MRWTVQSSDGSVRDGVVGRSHKVVACVVAGAVLACWLVAKNRLFRGLEYTSDLFSHLQISLSLGPGQHLLHENGFGDHRALHNYYLLPLLYPFTRPLGAYGLFLALALLIFVAVVRVLDLSRDRQDGPLLHLIVCSALVLGPVAFWMWDDPVYGWHTELLFFPLALLFAASLIRGRGAWVFAAAIVLVREEGAILGWAIHAAFQAVRRDAPVGDLDKRFPVARRLMLTTLVWLLVFAAGLGVLLAFQKHLGRSRVALGIIANPIHDESLRAAYLISLSDAFLLLASGAIAFVAVASIRALAWGALCSLPLLVPISIAAISFGPGALIGHGAAWPPRFVMLWSVLTAAALFGVRERPTRAMKLVAVALGIASIVAQSETLRWRRWYEIRRRILPTSGRLVASRLSPAENRLVWCLGDGLPRATPVAATGSLFAPFHRQEIVWPDRLATATHFPRVVACDQLQRIPFDYGCLALQRDVAAKRYDTIHVHGMVVSYEPALSSSVEPCVQ